VSEPLLRVEGLRTSFPSEAGRATVVDGVDFSVAEGEVLALVGESGCGKSVTALSIMRLVPRPGRIDAGRILLGDQNLLELPVTEMRQVRGSAISMIFQEPMTSLNPVQRVGDQVIEAIQLHNRVSKAEARKRTRELFEQVRISDAAERLDAYPHQLSGGMKQRVMIAMALSARPKLLIADEPTTALDVTIQAQILNLLRELRDELGTGILLITHDLGVVNEIADRVAVMYAGKVIEAAERVELLSEPRHPYTAGLLQSIPSRTGHGERLHEIEGVVPSPDEWPSGCRFSTRCERVFEPCRAQEPQRLELSIHHWCACHAVEKEEKQT
jgi:oligopeptide/dipeptide ABC transporter ATP-binding protein